MFMKILEGRIWKQNPGSIVYAKNSQVVQDINQKLARQK